MDFWMEGLIDVDIILMVGNGGRSVPWSLYQNRFNSAGVHIRIQNTIFYWGHGHGSHGSNLLFVAQTNQTTKIYIFIILF